MKNIVLINQMKAGKIDAFKKFLSDVASEHKEAYKDMLKRYGLKTSKVIYQKLNNVEFAVVIHEIEDYAFERLPNWASSTNPFDIWFKTQAQEFYDFESTQEAGQPSLILDFSL